MFDPELHTIHKVETQHSGILFTLIPYIRRKDLYICRNAFWQIKTVIAQVRNKNKSDWNPGRLISKIIELRLYATLSLEPYTEVDRAVTAWILNDQITECLLVETDKSDNTLLLCLIISCLFTMLAVVQLGSTIECRRYILCLYSWTYCTYVHEKYKVALFV